jgi:hypothetical protein
MVFIEMSIEDVLGFIDRSTRNIAKHPCILRTESTEVESFRIRLRLWRLR